MAEIRLVQAQNTQSYFKVFKKFYSQTPYHWLYGNRIASERIKSLKRPRGIYPEKFNRNGERIPSPREKFEKFSIKDYRHIFFEKNKEHKLYFIWVEGKLIGYVWIKGTCNPKRIYEFPISVQYQKREIIAKVIEGIKEMHKDVYIFFAEQYACKILEGVDIEIKLKRKKINKE